MLDLDFCEIRSFIIYTTSLLGTGLLYLSLCSSVQIFDLSQYYAHVENLCLNFDCFIRVYSLVSDFYLMTVLLEYI